MFDDDDDEDDGNRDRPHRDHFFDRWRVPRGDRLAPVVREVAAGLDAVDGPRKRRRKPEDLKAHEALVETIVANLAYAVVAGFEPPTLAVKASNAQAALSRYDRKGLHRLPSRLRELSRCGLAEFEVSKQRGWLSTVRPTDRFAALVQATGATFDDFTRAPNEETIVLREREYGFVENPRTGRAVRKKVAKRLDYEDDPESVRLRADMEAANAALESADLAFLGNDHIDTRQRRLYRVFNRVPDLGTSEGPFAFGGRLFGGWWQQIKKEERHLIRIDGEPIADLDYRNMFVRLAFLKAGVRPPDGDLYAGLPGFDDARHRSGVKGLLSALMFALKPRTTIPADLVAALPEGLKIAQARAAILRRHPELAGVIETGVGFSLFKTESTILLKALGLLTKAGIVALPMHDGIMVAGSKAARAEKAMGDAAEAVVGFRLPVDRKADLLPRSL